MNSKRAFFIFILGVFKTQAYFQSPARCFGKSLEKCCVGTVKKNDFLKWGGTVVDLGEKTILHTEGEKLFFDEGESVFKVDDQLEIGIKQTSIRLSRGEYLIKNTQQEFILRTLDGKMDIVIGNKALQLTEGFEVSLIPDNKYHYFHSVPRLIPLKAHVLEYAKVKKMSSSQSADYELKFAVKHRNYKLWADELNQSLVQRQLAEDKQVQLLKQEKQKQRELALAKVRKQFYEKVFER